VTLKILETMLDGWDMCCLACVGRAYQFCELVPTGKITAYPLTGFDRIQS
jgi:hypothetical protein